VERAWVVVFTGLLWKFLKQIIMAEKKKLVLIDADSLVFQCSKENLKESLDIIDERINNIFEATGADYYSMFISLGGYFRHKIDPSYKSNRKKYSTSLLWTRTLKNYLIEKYGAVAGKEVEADDLVNYFYNNKICIHYDAIGNPIISAKNDIFNLTADGEEMEVILASPDKDLLQSIPGKHFNYSYKLADKENPDSLVKGFWVDTSNTEADEFLRMQMIVGDVADGINGLSGKGPVYWKKMCAERTPFWSEILNEYIIHHGDASVGIFEFQKNYRLLKMLGNDNDFLREVGYIPEFNAYNVNNFIDNNDNGNEEVEF